MRKLLLLVFLLMCANSFAQRYSLSIVSAKDESLLSRIKYQKVFNSKNALDKELQKVLLTCQESGYLAASFDSIQKDSLNYKAELFFGAQYKWANLKKGNVDEGVL